MTSTKIMKFPAVGIVWFIYCNNYASFIGLFPAADVAFLLGSSPRTTPETWTAFQTFAKTVVDTLGASQDGVHYSAIAFNSEPRVIFRFNSLQGPQYTGENVKRRIDEMWYTGGETNIEKAVELANTVLFSPQSGARKDAPKVRLQFTQTCYKIFQAKKIRPLCLIFVDRSL